MVMHVRSTKWTPAGKTEAYQQDIKTNLENIEVEIENLSEVNLVMQTN